MSVVTLSGSDPELLNKLHQYFVLHSMKLHEVYYKHDDAAMWWRISRYGNNTLVILRSSYECIGSSGRVYDAFTIENWFNEIKCENPFYIYIDLFANGISFTIIEDVYGIMEE